MTKQTFDDKHWWKSEGRALHVSCTILYNLYVFRSVNAFLIFIMVWYLTKFVIYPINTDIKRGLLLLNTFFAPWNITSVIGGGPWSSYIDLFRAAKHTMPGLLHVFLKINNLALYIHLVTFTKKWDKTTKTGTCF